MSKEISFGKPIGKRVCSS